MKDDPRNPDRAVGPAPLPPLEIAGLDLRQRAEEKAGAQRAENVERLSPEEAARLLYELRVHQIELEAQNEELRLKQEELEASRARYFELYDLAPVGYFTLSEQGLILEANLTAATLLGVPRGALIKQPLSRLIVPEDEDIYYLYLKQLFETGAPQVCELRMVCQDVRSSQLWARLESVVAREEHGMPVCRVTMSDISEDKQVESSLQELSRDLDERVKELNCLVGISNLVEEPDISLEEILEGTVDLMPPAWQYPEVTCARIVLEGRDFRTDNFAQSPWQQMAEISVDGEPCGVVQVGYLEERPESDEGPFLKEERSLLNTIAKRMGEITERTRAQEQAIQQHQFLQNVLDSLPHPFYVINVQDRTVALANSAAAVGRLPGEITCSALMHGYDQACDTEQHPCPLREVVRTRKPVFLEHEHIDEDGLHKYVEVHGFPILNQQGDVVQMIEYTLDITERKRAEQAQRESEARWRSLTESSPDHILTLDTDLRIQFANFASPGLTVHELVGTPLYTLVDEDRQAEVRAILETVVQTGTPAWYETVYHSPDGDEIYYESRVSPRMLSHSDKVVGLTLSARDITERKQAEQALRDSEEKLRALFEILPVGISVLDDSRSIRLANPALARILHLPQDGLKNGEYQRRTYLRADGTEMPPEEFPSTRAFEEQALVRDVDIGVVKEDGELIWTSVSAAPLLTEDWRVIVATSDITIRKQAEAALVRARDELELRVKERTAELQDLNRSLLAEIAIRQRAEEDLQATEERFRQLAENTDDVIWLTEPASGQLLYISPAYEKVWGRSIQSLSARMDHLWTDVHPEDLELIPQDPVEGWVGQAIEFRLVPPDGQVRWIQARAFPVSDETGQIYRLVCIASDITEQKQTQTALIKAERLAIAGRMAASLGHEINNPLQAAIGCLELSLEQLDRGKDPHRHLQVTASALDRASRVVAQLRALHYPMDLEALEESDLNELVEGVLVLSEKRFLEQDIEVVWQAAPDLPPVSVMPDALQQVFLNLVLNAQDAMPEGGRLLVSTTRVKQPPGVEVKFADNGAGLSPEVRERLFEPFYTTKKDSLGLGLFISQNVVQQSGGCIEVQSQEGEGTTFSICLPLQQTEVG